MQNFAFPYFSRDVAEFWRRWHISLSTWFRDHLYIPLGGSKGSIWVKIRNTFLIFIVSGFWHGANWTFVAWGFLNAVYFLPLMLANRNRKHSKIVAQGKVVPTIKELIMMLSTFLFTVIAWVFFRADNMQHAFGYLSGIFSRTIISKPHFPDMGGAIIAIELLIVFVLVEWFGREQSFALEKMALKWWRPFRYAFYYGIVFMIVWFGGNDQQFIYFQF
jgi:D-alanyl-lipoteichoic acid acyltransferase DltB (MBOAT superfamily)